MQQLTIYIHFLRQGVTFIYFFFFLPVVSNDDEAFGTASYNFLLSQASSEILETKRGLKEEKVYFGLKTAL